MNIKFDWNEYKSRSRAMVSEGCVLLRLEEHALPIAEGETVSIFGRIQLDYYQYKSGTGSGGMVNAPYAVSVTEGLRNAGVKINEELEAIYTHFEEEHPFDKGAGWAKEPYSQEEMPLTKDITDAAAAKSDLAIVIIGRSAGEDKDAAPVPGSYYLSEREENMLALVTGCFRRTAVLLNVGAVMDMSWVEKYRPQAVMYIWQGGSEGGNGVADLLTGKVSPSGKLADTVALRIEDYPSCGCFGDPNRNIYKEDIYVGYRYFETFARDRVLYPFGFGLSYTSFDIRVSRFLTTGKEIRVEADVTNVGDRPGKETVQVYYCPPVGKLSKPMRALAGFAKTRELKPGETQTVTILFNAEDMASYDDGGLTGHRSAWVLEPGDYAIYCGSDVRSARFVGSHSQPELKVTEQLEEALAPTEPFERMRAEGNKIAWEQTPTRTIDLQERILKGRKPVDPYRGDQGIRLADVCDGKVKMDGFLSQLSDEDLIALSRGEGMCSPKVTPGIAGAFGGVTESLKEFGIPVAGCSDGPSGIRMDCGTMAFSNPNGTLIACSFNPFAVAQLFEYQGKELRLNKIDMLLGPGMNIHRNPLNGRNFEYFSEDPYLTGMMASAELTAMHRSHVTGVIKHFACNNQETGRNTANALVSERALREIYLKGFEIAVKKGGAYAIMSTYGPVNGLWTAGNYDLITTILRGDWHYKGIVMTDWMAMVNDEGKEASRSNTTAMIRAQNDLYMVVDNAGINSAGDNAPEGLAEGRITRSDLVRNAANICRVLMECPTMERLCGTTDTITEIDRPQGRGMELYSQPGAEIPSLTEAADLDVSGIHTNAGSGNMYPIETPEAGIYKAVMELSSTLGENAQAGLEIYVDNVPKNGLSLFGTEGRIVTKELEFDAVTSTHPYVNFFFAQSGITVHRITVRYVRPRQDKR